MTLNLGPIDPVNRVWTTTTAEDMQYQGYSLADGSNMWTTDIATRPMQFFGSGEGGGPRGVTAYGNIYVQGFGGEIFCYNAANGNLVWRFNNTNGGLETNWGLRPIFISAVADGKIYVFNNEHSPNAPLFRGNKVYALDAFTGEEIWSMFGWSGQTGGQGGSTAVLADGCLSYYNYYDNCMYVVGKGSSATTIAASPKISTFGKVVIEGKVIDTSAGTKDNEQQQDSQTVFQQYLTQVWHNGCNTFTCNQPAPTNVTGVEVTISVVDPNGNYYNVGTTTSDTSGNFKL